MAWSGNQSWTCLDLETLLKIGRPGAVRGTQLMQPRRLVPSGHTELQVQIPLARDAQAAGC
jgi:hypothetical protein